MRLFPRCFIALALFGCLASARAGFVIETADGLPVEVEMVSAYRDEITVRYTASQRVAKLSLKKLSPESRKKIIETADEARKQIKSATFTTRLEENTSTSNVLPLTQRGTLRLDKNGEPESVDAALELPPGSRSLRLTGSNNVGVDIPATAVIYWYTQPQGSSAWGVGSVEEVQLNVTFAPMEYLSKPTTFPRPAYRGHAVIIYNPMNGAILWKNSTGNAFLSDAEEKFATRKKN